MQEVEYKIIDQRKNKCNCEPQDTCFCDEDLVSCDSCGCYFEIIIIKYHVKFSASDRFYICEKCVDTSNYIIKKHKEVLGGQGLNNNAPTWQAMNDLAKAIIGDNLKTKIPLTNEMWINSKTNELIHVRSVSGSGNEMMFTNGFELFISSIDDFLLDHKFINGIESKKDLEIFELKELLKQSQELNANYEKIINEQKEEIQWYKDNEGNERCN